MDELTPAAERARALENSDQLEGALKLYLEAVDAEPDPVIWNRIGDLHARSGAEADAVTGYSNSVRLFAEQGLRNNAIAVCRKALRLAPESASLLLDLARISAELGYRTDARASFQQYAEHREQNGDPEGALEALRSHVEYFPGDLTVRRSLIDRLLAYDRTGDAVRELRSMRSWLLSEGRDADAEQAWEEIAALDPSAVREPAPSASPPPLFAGPGDESEDVETGIDPLPGLEPTLAGEATEAADAQLPTELDAEPLEGLELASTPVMDEENDENTTAAPLEPLTGRHTVDEAEVPQLEGLEPTTAGEGLLEGPAVPLPTLGEEDPGVMRFEGEEAPAADPETSPDVEDRSEHAEPLPLLDVGDWDAPAAGQEPIPNSGAGAARAVEPLAPEPQGDHTARPESTLAELQMHAEQAARSGDPRQLLGAYLALARHFRAEGDQAKARVVFQRVLEVEPEHEEARAALGEAGGPRADVASHPPAPAATPSDYVDLGELILGGDDLAEGTRFQVAVGDPTGDEERDFQEILGLFRQQIAARIDPGDAASHYDLGVAFKEMGLLDDAILQLQAALRGGANRLATLELLGECFAEKGDHSLASRVLTHASRLEGASDADLLAVLYLLGRSEEALGRAAEAESCYERVIALDFGFRDAAARLDSIRRFQARKAL